MSDCILQTVQYGFTIIKYYHAVSVSWPMPFQYKWRKMLNTVLCLFLNVCMHPFWLLLNVFYVESLFVVCTSEPTPHPTPSKYARTVPHFIQTDIVHNCTTKFAWSMVHGDKAIRYIWHEFASVLFIIIWCIQIVRTPPQVPHYLPLVAHQMP